MSRMRTCLSDLDLSKVYDSESENANKSASASRVQGLDLNLRGKGERPTLTERPRSWSAFDQGSPKSPLANYHQVRINQLFITTHKHSTVVMNHDHQSRSLHYFWCFRALVICLCNLGPGTTTKEYCHYFYHHIITPLLFLSPCYDYLITLLSSSTWQKATVAKWTCK